MQTSNGLLILPPRKQSEPASLLLKRHVPPSLSAPLWRLERSDVVGPKHLGPELLSIPKSLYSFGI